MNILITGSAGFIGFNISEHFLKKNYKVFGVDNFDDYYSVKLKRKRIEKIIEIVPIIIIIQIAIIIQQM